MNHDSIPRINRRDAIKWMLTAAGGVLLADSIPLSAAVSPSSPDKATGYGTDPDLLRIYQPGELWPSDLSKTVGSQHRISMQEIRSTQSGRLPSPPHIPLQRMQLQQLTYAWRVSRSRHYNG